MLLETLTWYIRRFWATLTLWAMPISMLTVENFKQGATQWMLSVVTEEASSYTVNPSRRFVTKLSCAKRMRIMMKATARTVRSRSSENRG